MVCLVWLLVLYIGKCCCSLHSLVAVLKHQWQVEDLIIVQHGNCTGWSHQDELQSWEVTIRGQWVTFLDASFDYDLHTAARASRRPVTALVLMPEYETKRYLKQSLSPPYGPMLPRIRFLTLASSREHFVSILDGVHIPINTQVYGVIVSTDWRDRNVTVSSADVFEAYHLCLYRRYEAVPEPVVTRVLTGTPLNLPQHELWARRKDLQGALIRIGTIEDRPDVIVDTCENGNGLGVTGYTPNVWKELESTLNFTTEYRYTIDGTWGREMKDRHWSGLIGMVERGEIDVALSGLSLTIPRIKVVDFTGVLYHRSYRVYYRKDPMGLSFSSITAITPLQFTKLFLSTVLLSSAAHVAVSRLTDLPECLEVIIFNNIFAFCLQGVPKMSLQERVSGQMALSVSYLAGLLVFNMFSATIISRLAVASNGQEYDSLADLISGGLYMLGVRRGTVDKDILENGYRNKTCWKNVQLLEDNFPTSNEQGMARVCNENFAFITTYRMWTNLLPCQPAFLTVTSMDDNFNLAVTKGLPYRRLFDIYIQRMREAGILEHIKARWLIEQLPSEGERTHLEMRLVSILLLWIALGMAMSFCFLVVELCMARRRATRNTLPFIN